MGCNSSKSTGTTETGEAPADQHENGGADQNNDDNPAASDEAGTGGD